MRLVREEGVVRVRVVMERSLLEVSVGEWEVVWVIWRVLILRDEAPLRRMEVEPGDIVILEKIVFWRVKVL